jgi:hypothetical protein
MLLRRSRQACFSFLVFLLIVGTRHCVTSVFTGIGKAILMLAFATLLMFLVVRSADIFERLTACLQTLCSYLFEPASTLGFAKQPATSFSVSRKPSLPFRFQLPPPISSL